ncbi:LOW QUALITY PROTEIN: thioredoxin domain-containing protein 15-like [Trichoplusia ni]|uniref:Thioredoxin domain-containing protein 15-like n=1 Tax=Trichoplusia ni TaxID=7111 RepID=A0A7E5X038_TRINI|nr:thioredoxin domain-containing protein 15-like [Trichoplusia ni]XP_026745801.1 LOW QUALITY PROTEIN: thioredoxin domain-containing protein 15-like [Trichoplusia ni]
MDLRLSRHFYTALLIVIGLAAITIQFDIQEEPEITTETEENVEMDVPNVDESESLLSNVVSDVNKTLTSIYNTVTLANVTAENTTQTANETRKLVKCKEIVYDQSEEIEPSVEIVNASKLIRLLTVKPDITSRDMEADCILVFFYARACPFSAHAAPHFNALARSYPSVKMVALDALKYGGTNTVYGIVGVPTLKMFHNGRPCGKFNGTEYNIQSFSKFVHAITGQYPQTLLVTSKDFQGPVSSVVETETDYFLVLSWLFIIVCSIHYFMQSKWWRMIVEMVQNNWRESEAQHEHND